MKKIHQNQKGFAALEAFLILVIVVLIGVVGWLVYKNHHKTSSTTGTSSKTSVTKPAAVSTAGWKTFSNNSVSFQYPSGWTASNGPGFSQSTQADATSPAFKTTAAVPQGSSGNSIWLYLQASTDSGTIGCAESPCKVVAVVPLNNSETPSAALAIVNQTSGNSTPFTEYVMVKDTTKVGDTKIIPEELGGSSSGSGLYIFGQPVYYTTSHNPTDLVAAQISNVAALQADSHFGDLIKLINSISIQVRN